MEIKIEEMPLKNIVFIRNIGPYGKGNYVTMEKIKEFAKSNKLFNEETIILGISKDDPKITDINKCRYDACIVVSGTFNIYDTDIQDGIFEGGKYAVFIIDHTEEAVKKAWNEIFIEVLNKGYKLDLSRDIIEKYAMKMVNNHKCEICVPII